MGIVQTCGGYLIGWGRMFKRVTSRLVKSPIEANCIEANFIEYLKSRNLYDVFVQDGSVSQPIMSQFNDLLEFRADDHPRVSSFFERPVSENIDKKSWCYLFLDSHVLPSLIFLLLDSGSALDNWIHKDSGVPRESLALQRVKKLAEALLKLKPVYERHVNYFSQLDIDIADSKTGGLLYFLFFRFESQSSLQPDSVGIRPEDARLFVEDDGSTIKWDNVYFHMSMFISLQCFHRLKQSGTSVGERKELFELLNNQAPAFLMRADDPQSKQKSEVKLAEKYFSVLVPFPGRQQLDEDGSRARGSAEPDATRPKGEVLPAFLIQNRSGSVMDVFSNLITLYDRLSSVEEAGPVRDLLNVFYTTHAGVNMSSELVNMIDLNRCAQDVLMRLLVLVLPDCTGSVSILSDLYDDCLKLEEYKRQLESRLLDGKVDQTLVSHFLAHVDAMPCGQNVLQLAQCRLLVQRKERTIITLAKEARLDETCLFNDEQNNIISAENVGEVKRLASLVIHKVRVVSPELYRGSGSPVSCEGIFRSYRYARWGQREAHSPVSFQSSSPVKLEQRSSARSPGGGSGRL